MIPAKLTDEFIATFSREKRARVCLWFDEHREFDRLLPALRSHLAKLPTTPFTLLAYDESAGHGQLWIRAQIDWEGRDLPPEERAARRFVVYLPFAPERLQGPESSDDRPDDRRAPWLEFLHLYDSGGVRWRVDGREPTMFSFLRAAGVNLPRDARDQRALWQDGRDSLLARFAARHATEDALFWTTAWTAPLVKDACSATSTASSWNGLSRLLRSSPTCSTADCSKTSWRGSPTASTSTPRTRSSPPRTRPSGSVDSRRTWRSSRSSTPSTGPTISPSRPGSPGQLPGPRV